MHLNTCLITNSYEILLCNFTNFNEDSKLVLAKPTVDVTPKWIQAYENTDLHLNCITSGNPKSTITWTRLIGSMPNNNKIMPNGTLLLKGMKKEHSGIYQCKATNAIGASSAVSSVAVKGKIII